MKKYINILTFGILIVLNACNSYKQEDLDYFENTSRGLRQSIRHSEDFLQTKLKYLESMVIKERNIDILAKYLKDSHILLKTISACNKEMDYVIKDLREYVEEDEGYKYYSALSLLENLDSSNIEIQKCLDFLVKNYGELLEDETKEWYQNIDDFLERELEGLPLYGGVSKLFQIQHHLLEENKKIAQHLFKKAKEVKGKSNLHLHLAAQEYKIRLGEVYKAHINFLEVPSPKELEMKIDGQKLKVENGMGKLRLKAQGLGRKRHTIEIKTKNYFGRDTIWKVKDAHPIYEVIPKK